MLTAGMRSRLLPVVHRDRNHDLVLVGGMVLISSRVDRMGIQKADANAQGKLWDGEERTGHRCVSGASRPPSHPSRVRDTRQCDASGWRQLTKPSILALAMVLCPER